MKQNSEPSISAKRSAAANPAGQSATLPKAAANSRTQPADAHVAQGAVLRRAVRFGLELPGARKVAVVGTFNNWNPEATPLRCVGDRKWFVYLPLEIGRHEYRFMVDGKWMDDPKARNFALAPQGGRNAVLEVTDRRLEP